MNLRIKIEGKPQTRTVQDQMAGSSRDGFTGKRNDWIQ